MTEVVSDIDAFIPKFAPIMKRKNKNRQKPVAYELASIGSSGHTLRDAARPLSPLFERALRLSLLARNGLDARLERRNTCDCL